MHPTCMQVAPSRWEPMIDTSPLPVRRTWRFQKCCTPVWLVFSNTTRMRCWVLPGSVQLQDYYIHPEKMGASRKDLADAIQSYSDNDSQKNGELFSSHYRLSPQTHAEVL